MPHPRTKPKKHIHSQSQSYWTCQTPRKSLLAASYPGLVISNAKVNRSNLHVQHTFLHIVVRADDSLRTKISWVHFGCFPSQNLRWLDWIFWGGYLPSLSINYVAMSEDMRNRLPQLYYIKMKISYDLGFIAIGVTMAT